jgi:subfamily B ATP-binding cassette protein HlyB/CyaB
VRGDASAALALSVPAADTFWAIGSLCNLHRLPFEPGIVARAHPPPHTLSTLVEALRSMGCEADVAVRRADRLRELAMPCIAVLAPAAEPSGEAAAVGGWAAEARLALLVRVDGDRVLYFAAGANAPTVSSFAKFARDYVGAAVTVSGPPGSPVDADLPPPARFGYRWFVPELLRHRGVWRDVLAASLALQMIALAAPLLSQVLIDRVIVHRATSTLMVIATALALTVLFSAGLGWIRQYLVLHVGNRVDAVLGAAVFRHLLGVPLRYFEPRPTGVLTARLSGIEAIREFLTGAAITIALDVPFLLVFLAVMLVYSVTLSLVTVLLVGVLVVLSAAAAPVLKRRFDEQFQAGARQQAFVTEHLAAIETVKSLELEPQLASRYEHLLAQLLETGFRARQAASTYHTAAQAIEQTLSVAILCVGAWLVMRSPDFTIGMLVAFQMFASRVAQPLLRLAGLWQQAQQASIAVRRLADIMDVPREPRTLAPIRAATGPVGIELVGLGYRQAPERPWLYRGLDARIGPGECVVITGPSGSGKSTLLRLLQGFAYPVEGAVRIDGRDTRALAVNELRGRLGIVLQDTSLFSGTLLANLELANPLAGIDQITQACRIAGVHATIERLPEGYRTEVGERGVGLSGGQRQRLALARALLRRPGALLLDEPFSQLDQDSAREVADALSRLRGTLTIVVVSHVLPATLRFDRRIDLAPAA